MVNLKIYNIKGIIIISIFYINALQINEIEIADTNCMQLSRISRTPTLNQYYKKQAKEKIIMT